MKPYILGIAGYSGSGKTTLIEKMIPCLDEKNLKVMVIKHDVHGINIDSMGKDTYRFSSAGAERVMISSDINGFVEISKKTKTLEEMLQDASGVDIVIIEGYKKADIPKMVMLTEGIAGAEELLADKNLRAVITNNIKYASDMMVKYGLSETRENKTPVFLRDDIHAITSFVINEYRYKG
ncbi:MAG: molybdopterin-guanine dinucleotide biosynthesis protein B [Eubacterium sp.]|nr:molybdopterin-guanine dinucleotide biosynthesis protein B [Eubacterium sp.]